MFLRDMPVRWVWSLIAVAGCYPLHRMVTSRQKKLPSLLMAMIELILLVLVGLWLLPFLEKFGINTRLLFGVMVAMALLMMSLWQTSSSLLKWGKLFPVVVSWFFLSYAFTYGNAMAAQKEYTQNQATTISQILLREVPQLIEQNRILKIESNEYTSLIAPKEQHTIREYPVLTRTIFGPLKNFQKWNSRSNIILGMQVVDYLNQSTISIPTQGRSLPENEKQADLIYQDVAYSIYMTEETIYVILNKVNDNT